MDNKQSLMDKMNRDIAVIFDFNGTCIFDGPLHIKAWRLYVEELTLHKVSDAEASEWIEGKTAKEILEHFLGYELNDNMVFQLSEEKERISGTRSVAERFDIADNGMEQGDKAALDTEKSTQEAVEKALPSPMDKVPIKDEKPQNKASEHHDGITFFKSDPNDTLEDIHRKMAESYDPWEDDSY